MLHFSASKFSGIHLGKQVDPANYTMTSHSKIVTLKTIQMVMDLGVNVDAELPFGQHVEIQAQKANTLFGMLRS